MCVRGAELDLVTTDRPLEHRTDEAQVALEQEVGGGPGRHRAHVHDVHLLAPAPPAAAAFAAAGGGGGQRGEDADKQQPISGHPPPADQTTRSLGYCVVARARLCSPRVTPRLSLYI